jgi:hypothetical protein
MKTLRTKDDTLDFEAWAIMLLWRKVPDSYHHLINSEVVHDGAAILQRGDAFEVRVHDGAVHEEILITPFPTIPAAPLERHWRA